MPGVYNINYFLYDGSEAFAQINRHLFQQSQMNRPLLLDLNASMGSSCAAFAAGEDADLTSALGDRYQHDVHNYRT